MSTHDRRRPMIEVRHSPVHGYGVFALRRIRKGTTVIEYLGDRITHDEADERYADKDEKDNHTFLFTVNSKIVIDAGRNGNEARFINHGCEPNCESGILAKRVFIDALRTIQPGEELVYDYQITRDPDDPDDVDEIFACRCGAPNCRGSMLEPKKPPRKKPKPRKRPRPRTAARDTRAAPKTNTTKTPTSRRPRGRAELARPAQASRRARR
jgi:SET domain-containing protein